MFSFPMDCLILTRQLFSDVSTFLSNIYPLLQLIPFNAVMEDLGMSLKCHTTMKRKSKQRAGQDYTVSSFAIQNTPSEKKQSAHIKGIEFLSHLNLMLFYSLI